MKTEQSKKEISVDTFSCKGCGACEEVAPEHFKMDKGQGVPIILEDVVEGEHDDLDQAKAYCPSDSIEVKELNDK